MKINAIIEVILRTPALNGSRLELAALVARDGQQDAIDEVAEFWRRNGGTVES